MLEPAVTPVSAGKICHHRTAHGERSINVLGGGASSHFFQTDRPTCWDPAVDARQRREFTMAKTAPQGGGRGEDPRARPVIPGSNLHIHSYP
jgi:hypothetical protein